MSGDLAKSDAEHVAYDAGLEAAVRRFQARHGLEVDGLVGKMTLTAIQRLVGILLLAVALGLGSGVL